MSHTTRLVAVFAALAAILALYWSTTATLITRWSALDEAYSHGFISLLVASAMFAKLFSVRDDAHSHFRCIVLSVLVVGSIGWFICKTIGFGAGEQGFFWIVVISGVSGLFNVTPDWRLMLPALVFLLGIPVWDHANDVLRGIATLVTESGLRSLGLAAFVSDYHIELPFGTFLVATGCSGLAFFLASLLCSIIYIYLWELSFRSALVVLTLAIVLGLATNWIRITTIVVFGYVYKMDHFLIQQDHYWFGWGLCAIMLVLGYKICQWLNLDQTSGTGLGAQPRGRGREFKLLITIVIGCIALGPMLSTVAESRGRTKALTLTSGWVQELERLGFEVAVEGGAVTAKKSNARISINVYAVQRQGREIRSSDALGGFGTDQSFVRYRIGDQLSSDLDSRNMDLIKSLLSDMRSDAYMFELVCQGDQACLTSDDDQRFIESLGFALP